MGFRGSIGIMEKIMETTIVYWGYMGAKYRVVYGFWGLGFWGLGFWGFRVLGFRVLGV